MQRHKTRTKLAIKLFAVLLAGLSSLVLAQPPAAPRPLPAPRDAEGHILISNPPGTPRGLWVTDYSRNTSSSFGGSFFDINSIAFKPWARGLFDARQAHDLEPHARCKASGAIRQFLTPYGVEMLQPEGSGTLYIFDIGGPHTFREIHMDGRSHPRKLQASNYGHSVGWWDGDTLVVDSVGYNTDFWFERMGLPHTENVHVTEYFTRLNSHQMDYRFILTDTTAYDAPVEGRLALRWEDGIELFEYICQDSNYAEDLMVNENMQSVGKTSPIVP